MQMYDMNITYTLRKDYFFVKKDGTSASEDRINRGNYPIFAIGKQLLFCVA